MPTPSLYSPRLQKAIDVATRAHDGHYRKSTTLPYVSHLFSVMLLTAGETTDEDVLIAALLHDVIEDVPENYSWAQMHADFGETVVELVEGVTKDSSLPDWHDRSRAYLEHLAQAPSGSIIVAACDKYHNLACILADHEQLGDGIWGRFNSGKQSQQWWYRAVYEVVASRLPHLHVLDAYRAGLDRLDVL